MPAPTYTVPTNNSDTATEEPKITIALSDLKTLLTGNLDDDNISTGGISYSKLNLTGLIRNADVKSDAAIAHTKLALIPNGSVLGGSGGVNTTLTIASLLTNIGTLGDINGFDVNIARDGSTYTPLDVDFTPPAGQYLIVAYTRFDKGSSGGISSSILRIRTSTAVTLGYDERELAAGDAQSSVAVALYESAGGVQILADATSTAASGTVVCKATHGIVGLPVGNIANL